MTNAWSEIVIIIAPCLAFYCIFLAWFIREYGISQLPLPTNNMGLFKPYPVNHNPMTTSNLMLYLQHNLIL